jgi:hypothetical protein
LSFASIKENISGNIFRHEEREFGGNMETVPQAAKVVEVEFGGVVDGIESAGVGRNVLFQVNSNNRNLIESDERMPRFRSYTQIKDVLKR